MQKFKQITSVTAEKRCRETS